MSSTTQHGASGSSCCKNSPVEPNSLGSRPTDRNRLLNASRTSGSSSTTRTIGISGTASICFDGLRCVTTNPSCRRTGCLDCHAASASHTRAPWLRRSSGKLKVPTPPVLIIEDDIELGASRLHRRRLANAVTTEGVVASLPSRPRGSTDSPVSAALIESLWLQIGPYFNLLRPRQLLLDQFQPSDRRRGAHARRRRFGASGDKGRYRPRAFDVLDSMLG